MAQYLTTKEILILAMHLKLQHHSQATLQALQQPLLAQLSS
jgi:hypothetical protein